MRLAGTGPAAGQGGHDADLDFPAVSTLHGKNHIDGLPQAAGADGGVAHEAFACGRGSNARFAVFDN
jgi:hypothetical protein